MPRRIQLIVNNFSLLGLDTNGHAFRPHSDTYLANIKLVDSRIPGLVNLFDSFYGDGNTAYVFTADHGMNSRGAHGDGDKENTETPLVCWGSGVAGPYKNPTRQKTADELRWNLSDLDRHDVEQGDIAPLMSTLLGLPPPMNAVGKLPLPYLDPSLGEGFRAAAALANARQAFAQYSVKEAAKRRTEPWFKPFPGFDLHGDDMLDKAAALIDRGAFVESETLSMKIVELSTEGNRYYQTYDWLFLRTVVSIGYLGWIVFGISWTIEAYSDVATTKKSSASWASAVGFNRRRFIHLLITGFAADECLGSGFRMFICHLPILQGVALDVLCVHLFPDPFLVRIAQAPSEPLVFGARELDSKIVDNVDR